MAKRITEHRVRNWAIGGGASGVVILLLFAFLSSLGSIEVTGHSEDMICAGTLEDPCIATINFTAKEDIFIYPSENWSEAILETDKSVKSVKMFRSWGTGWREIKLNEVCTGTWCGAPDNSGDNKYAFAFREDRNYTIKYEVLKNSPYDKIKWSFGPVDPLFDSVADIELVSESNSLTHGEAVVKITPKISFAFEGNKVDTWVNKITPAMDLTEYEMSIGQNMSYQEEVWISNLVCNPWNETIANGTIEHSGCVDNGYKDYITKYKITYLPFENQNFQLTKEEPIYLKVSGKWPAQIGEVIYDWKINLDGYITTFQWWNSSWLKEKPIDVSVASGYTGLNYQVRMNITHDSDMNASFKDLRFVNGSEDTELDYWIEEKVDSTWALVWVEVDQNITTSNYTFYMYYDNQDVESTSNGTNTFAIWDDFSVDTGWTSNSSVMYINTTQEALQANISRVPNLRNIYKALSINLPGDLFIRFRINWYQAQTVATYSFIGCSENQGPLSDNDAKSTTRGISAQQSWSGGEVYWNLRFRDSTGDHYSPWMDYHPPIATWHRVKFTRLGYVLDNNLSYDNRTFIENESYTATSIDEMAYFQVVDGWVAGPVCCQYIYIDDLFAGYYHDPEPITYIGEEETRDDAPTIILNTPADTTILTNSSVTFNCSAYDDFNLTNVSLFIDAVLNETNTSGINNTDYIFSKNLSIGDYNWTCQGCDNATQCTNGTLRTFSIELNITGWVQDNVGNFLSGAYVFITNQSDNNTYGPIITNATGYWTFGPVLSGYYFITGYDPSNSSRDGDAAPWIEVP